ncbi:hypothetical protein [Cellulomonas sp. NPDC089187]|uniref:hypothetical protein n=1 Tax=Cellulomonas sp. NPDC089187 TaxID=3154970 RepID=UPI003415DCED
MNVPRHAPGPRHRTSVDGVLLRSALLGVAAGCRASLGVAAPVLTSDVPRLVRLTARAGVAGELIGDKLPSTPSRLLPPSPQGRIVSGATGAVALARRARRPVWSAAGLGALGAAAGTWGGAAWRSWAGRRGPDWRGALVEDAVAVGLAAVACRRGRVR